MAYEAFEQNVFPIFIFYIFLSAFGILMTIKIFLNYHQRKNKPSLYLSLVFAFLTLGVVILLIGLAEAVITGYYKEIYRLSLPLAFSMTILADFFLFIFTNYFTERGKKAYFPIAIICIMIVVLLFLPWNWWGYPNEEYEGKLNIRIYSTLSVVLFSCSIYIINIIIFQITRKRSDNKFNRVRLTLLSISMVCMICFWLMQIGDTLLHVLAGHPGYSGFVYVAWIFASIFIVLAYISLFMPKRLRKLINGK